MASAVASAVAVNAPAIQHTALEISIIVCIMMFGFKDFVCYRCQFVDYRQRCGE